jgi:hypothetical protein
MKYKWIYSFMLLHAAVSLMAFLALNGAALAAADAGRVAPLMGVLAPVVHYVLLQPIAHWLLAVTAIAWWTWPGLVALVAVVLLNSTLATLALHLALGRLRRSGDSESR